MISFIFDIIVVIISVITVVTLLIVLLFIITGGLLVGKFLYTSIDYQIYANFIRKKHRLITRQDLENIEDYEEPETGGD